MSDFEQAFTVGQDFGTAVCDWFSLDPSMVASPLTLNTGHNEPLSVTLTIMLSPEDMQGIAQAMKNAQRNEPDTTGHEQGNS